MANYFYNKEKNQIIQLEDEVIFVFLPIEGASMGVPAVRTIQPMKKSPGRPKVEMERPKPVENLEEKREKIHDKGKMIQEFGITAVNQVIDMYLVGNDEEKIARATNLKVEHVEKIIDHCI